MSNVNDRIKELRLNLNMSQDAFGKAIGLSKSGISNIENGTRNVRDNHIKLLCSTFGVSEDWLRTGNTLSKEVKEFEVFLSYLKSIGYVCELIQISEDDYEIELRKNGVTTLFSKVEFENLQNNNKNSIDGLVLLQNHKQ